MGSEMCIRDRRNPIRYGDTEENRCRYEAEQKQRQYERRIRALKKERAAMQIIGDQDAVAALTAKLRNRQSELQVHCDKYGLRRAYSRELVQEQVAKNNQGPFTAASENANISKDDGDNRLKPDLQLFAKKPSEYKTVFLPEKEYSKVMHEISTNLTDEQNNSKMFSKHIGDYIYFVENNGFGNYRVIGKEPID